MSTGATREAQGMNVAMALMSGRSANESSHARKNSRMTSLNAANS